MGLIKTSYRWAAALALLHMIALGGGAAYLLSSGTVDADRLREAVAVLTTPESTEPEAVGAADGSASNAPADRASSGLTPDEQRIEDEKIWRNAQRYRTQIDQRLKFINAARLDVDRRREELARLRKKDRKEREARAERESMAGHAKQVEILSSLKPKTALAQIMSMSDVDAAQILFQLNTRKVTKIVEAAKSEAQSTKIESILKLIADLKPDGEALATKGAP